MIFLNALFGYLCIAIIFKWLAAKTTDLYHVMIFMFLSPGTVDESGFLYNGQAGLQVSCSSSRTSYASPVEVHKPAAC